MDEQTLVGQKLLRLVGDDAEGASRDKLARSLESDWSADCLLLLLDSPRAEVVRAAALALSLVGDMDVCDRLADLLHHDDGAVVAAAEEAMWTLWFRAGGPLGRAVLTRIAESIGEGDHEGSVPLLTELIRTMPAFAEAFHQRAQAQYLRGDFEMCLRDARRACELNRHHFAALALQGHALAATGRFGEALKVYRCVLRIHPRMEGIRQTIQETRQQITATRPDPVHA